MSTEHDETLCDSLHAQPTDESADQPPVPTTDEQAARFRAAFAYAGYSGPKDIGAALGVSDATVKRLANGTGTYTRDRWERVMELTGVPRWFIDAGWEGANIPNDIGLAEKVEALDSQMRVVLDLLGVRVAGSTAGASGVSVVPPQVRPADPEGDGEPGPPA